MALQLCDNMFAATFGSSQSLQTRQIYAFGNSRHPQAGRNYTFGNARYPQTGQIHTFGNARVPKQSVIMLSGISEALPQAAATKIHYQYLRR